ncbi:MAG: thiolase family protein [Calditrichaeota bacterium]|nr:thiolase family protein [Calditrichota bacterium]MCB9367781.1 thiolase family protein [Calditrichota bacterium]
MNPNTPVITSGARTAIGSFMGALASVPAPALAAHVLKANLDRSQVDPKEVEEVILGQVLQAGVGQAPARQAALFAGIPNTTSAWTVNKVCSSGLRSIMSAAQAIALGDAKVMLAGGMENMSLAPYSLDRARSGYRLGNGSITDLMVNDGLWDPHNNIHMGSCAEMCAKEHKITREQQDEFAAESYRRAIASIKDGKFKAEIVPVVIKGRKGEVSIDTDEEPGNVNFDKMPQLKPAFEKDGTITAANASKINDGASAVMVMSYEESQRRGLKPLARIVGHTTYSQSPEWFTTAPASAVQKLLRRIDWKVSDVDLWELNEAFSVVGLYNMKEIGATAANTNVWGGAVALGHPIGSSGCRIVITLLHALKDRGGKRGVVGICNGGGEATAMAVEMM